MNHSGQSSRLLSDTLISLLPSCIYMSSNIYNFFCSPMSLCLPLLWIHIYHIVHNKTQKHHCASLLGDFAFLSGLSSFTVTASLNAEIQTSKDLQCSSITSLKRFLIYSAASSAISFMPGSLYSFVYPA